MSGVVLYSPEEARRNTFSVTKFHTLLGAELHTPDYDGPADFVINRTNDPAVARRFESQGVRVFNPAAFCALANDKDACYRFMAAKGVEILPIDQTEPPMVVKPKDGHGGQGVRLIRSGEPVPPQDGNLVYQAVADTPGQDLRVAAGRRNLRRLPASLRHGLSLQLLPGGQRRGLSPLSGRTGAGEQHRRLGAGGLLRHRLCAPPRPLGL